MVNRAGNLRWVRLLYGALIMIAVGFIYSWSIFATPFAEEFAWDAQTLSLNFSILMLSFCLGGLLGAQVAERRSARFAFVCATAMIAIGFLGALLVSRDTPWVFYLTYALFCGTTSGLSYTVVMATVIPWFQDRVGLASGILLMAYSCATMLHGVTATLLFAQYGWRVTFVIYALVIMVILLGGAFVMRGPRFGETAGLTNGALARGDGLDEDGGLGESDGLTKNVGLNGGDDSTGNDTPVKGETQTRAHPVLIPKHDYRTTRMLKTPLFYLYVLWMLLVCSISLAFTGHINQLALSLGATIAVAVAFVSLYSFVNAFARMAMGVFLDRFGLLGTMFIDALLLCVGAGLIVLSLRLGSIILLVPSVILFSIGMSGTPVCGSAFMALWFGPTHYGTNLAVLNTTNVPAGFIGPSIMAFSMIGTGSYSIAMTVLFVLGLAAIALVLVFGIWGRREDLRSQD
jgi:OFA family oxalate/formate antiporter-like MFS transporter